MTSFRHLKPFVVHDKLYAGDLQEIIIVLWGTLLNSYVEVMPRHSSNVMIAWT